jgi:hypothetical protein
MQPESISCSSAHRANSQPSTVAALRTTVSPREEETRGARPHSVVGCHHHRRHQRQEEVEDLGVFFLFGLGRCPPKPHARGSK